MARASDTAEAGREVATSHGTLAECARGIVATCAPGDKVALAKSAAHAWRMGALAVSIRSAPLTMPDRPGRPLRPVLMPPRAMPKRSTGGLKGRFALLHSLAHIELNAVDMTWDLIGRFAR
jgi:uncharacterized ferritin-like protein (DUF455 family)